MDRTAEPQPATARQHPFALNRRERADAAKLHVVCIGLAVVLIAHCSGKLRELLDAAENDCGRAHQRGYEQAQNERMARHRYRRSKFSGAGNCECGWPEKAPIHGRAR